MLLFAACSYIAIAKSTDFQPRIVKGFAARVGMFPSYAFLNIALENGKFKDCGATILSNEWLVTAAHCILDAKSVEVFLGKTQLNRAEPNQQVFVVKKENLYTYPQYFQAMAWNDIGV